MKHKDSHKINQKVTKLLLTVCLDALALLRTNMQENSQIYRLYSNCHVGFTAGNQKQRN